MENVDIVIRDRIQRSIQTSIQAIGASADVAGVKVDRLKTRINLGNGQFATSTISRPYEQVGRSADRARTSVNAFGNASRKSFQGASSGALLLLRQMRNLAAVMAGLSAARGVVNAVDNFQQMRNRLRSVTESSDQLNASQRRLFEIANDARVPVLGLTTAYQRYDKALSRVGASQEEVFQFTETISKALKIAGSTASETESVLIQLGQALTKGNLDGEELRSLRENAPIEVMEALADVMGVNVGQLKELGREGRLTTSVIRQAVRNLRDGVQSDFEQMIPTIGESLVVLANRFSEFAGNSQGFQNVVNLISNSILGLANNIPGAIRNVQGLAAAFATFKGVNLLLAAIPATLGRVAAGFAAVRTAGVSFAGVMAGLRAGMAGLLATMSRLGVVGLAALVGTMVAFRNEIQLAEDSNATLGDAITVEWNLIGETIKNITGDAKGDIDKLFSPDSLSEFFQGFTGTIKTIFSAFIQFGNNARIFVVDLFFQVIETIQTTFYRVINTLDSALTQTLNNMRSKINEVSQFFGQGDVLATDVGFPEREAQRLKIIDDLIAKSKERSQSYRDDMLSISEAEQEFDQILTDLFGNRQQLYEEQAAKRVAAEQAAKQQIIAENESLRTAEEAAAAQRTASAAQRIQQESQQRLQAIFSESQQSQQAFLQTQQGKFNAERAMTEVARQSALERDRINLIQNQQLQQRELQTSQVLQQSWDITSRYIQERAVQFGQTVLQILNRIMQAVRNVISAMSSVASRIPGASAAGNAISDVVGGRLEGLANIGSSLINSDLGQGIADSLGPITNLVGDAITAGVQRGFEQTATSDILSEGGGGFRANLESAISNITGDSTLNPFQQLAGINAAAGSSALGEGIDSLSNKIRTAAGASLDLSDKFKSLVGTGSQLGDIPAPMT